MTKDLIVQHTPLQIVMLGLFLFTIIFAGMATWVFRKDSKKKYDELSNLPFKTME